MVNLMDKLDKIINGLQCCHQINQTECFKCSYARGNGCTYALMGDILTMLKEQKPVVDIDTWKCGNCGHTLEHQELLGDNVLFHEHYNYCPECGRKVKWNV